MRTSDPVSAIMKKLLKIQREMGPINKNALNPFTNSKYANLQTCIEVFVPLLNAEHILILQPAIGDGSAAGCETILYDVESEQFISAELMLPLIKNDPQAAGSAITYARRYSHLAILDAVAEDDDGEGSMEREPKPKKERTPKEKAPKVEKSPEDLHLQKTAMAKWGDLVKRDAFWAANPDFNRKDPDAVRHYLMQQLYSRGSFNQLTKEQKVDFIERIDKHLRSTPK